MLLKKIARRVFLGNALAVWLGGSFLFRGKAEAEVQQLKNTADWESRCPYFDQPLRCRALLERGEKPYCR